MIGTYEINDVGDLEKEDDLPPICDMSWQVLPGELSVPNHCYSTQHMLFSDTWTST